LVKGDIADNHASMVEVYTQVDLLPPQWKPAADDVDVHMIAIATDTGSLTRGQDADAVKIGDNAGSPWNDDESWLYNPGGATEDHDFGFDDDMMYGNDDYSIRRWHRSQRRKALTSDVSNKTWTVYNAPLGYCDGSAQSRCNRNVFNYCLLANYNHYKAGIIAHGSSGKLSLSIPNVKEGIILARFEWQLEDGPRVKNLPPDFRFEYTVNGNKTSLNRSQFAAAAVDVTEGLRLHALLMDTAMSRNANATKTVDIDIEVVSVIAGVTPLILLSHIYYA
jgi:hypothetical protein